MVVRWCFCILESLVAVLPVYGITGLWHPSIGRMDDESCQLSMIPYTGRTTAF